MNLKALQEAIRTVWVLPASGLVASKIYFGFQDGVSPAPGPCIAIELSGPATIGQDQVRKTFDGAAQAGQEIVFTASGPRELVCRMQAFSPAANATDMENDARALLSRVNTALSLPTIRPTLNKLGLGVLRRGNVQWVPGIARAGWEGRATLEVVFCVGETAQGSIGYIETVKGTGTVDGGPPVPYTLVIED